MSEICSTDFLQSGLALGTSRRAAVQPTTPGFFVCRSLARGAAAGSGTAPLAGPVRAEAPRDALFEVAICHAEIPA